MDIKSVLEIAFLPNWNTHAYICKDGEIWIQLILGKCFNKEMFENSSEFKNMFNEEEINKRRELFDELYKYYKEKYQ
jgi:hypothetical protein